MPDSISTINKKHVFERVMRSYGITEVYANNGFSFYNDAGSFLMVTGKDSNCDTANQIFVELLDVLRMKSTIKVTFRHIAEQSLGYCMIWRSGVWYV